MSSEESESALSKEALAHYNLGQENERLRSGFGLIEYERTLELMGRYLPLPPASLIDIGGGTGVYAFPLARQGYAVHLIDAVPLHVEQAKVTAQANPDAPLASVAVGDARKLEWPENSFEAALLFGPIYHLTDRADRVRAFQEAFRVLRPGGVMMAAAVSRFASALDGLSTGVLEDPVFAAIVQQDLTDGQHRNPTNHPGYFTTTFFHLASELQAEVEESGFSLENIVAVEGPVWLSEYATSRWPDPQWRERVLAVLRRIETEPSLLGASAHLMVVGRKPA